MTRLTKTSIGRLRLTGIIEGCSYLLLLFIAMPLKYVAGIPEPVKFTGWIHGVFFILFLLALLDCMVSVKMSFKKAFVAFVASLVPFGTFWLDRQLKKEEILIMESQKA